MTTNKSYSGELAAKLADYRQRGQKEASKLRPAQDAAVPDQNESALRSEAEGWLSSEQRQFDTTLTELSRGVTEARQKAIELRGQVDQIVGDDSASSAIEAELAGDRPALVNVTEARLRAEVALKYFRAANDIHEEARYPDSKIHHVAVVLVLALIETVVNTFFYENSQGLLGGFFVALGITTLNIGFALLFGYWFRYQNLAAIDKKVAGWMAMAAFIFVTIFFNALFAAFRTEYQLVLDPSDFKELNAAFQRAWPEAMLIFRGDPQFRDLWSFVLFGMGVLLGILAFWKGYTADDKYPGHGDMDRDYKKASAEEAQQQNLVRQKVRELLHHRSATVQAALHEPSTQVGMLARRVAELTHARGSLQTQASAIQRDYSLVVDAYRSANNSVRSVPSPTYFSQPTLLSMSVDGKGADAVLAELAAVQQELKTMSDANREPLNERLKTQQQNSTKLLGTTLPDYFDAVRKDAEAAISQMTPTIHRVPAVPTN
ncbi:MAG: hypothetical protein K0B16_13225 [Burkholderiaceae bacterium]|nr:hypothetical protein [Burkholderiaceae bacterium]